MKLWIILLLACCFGQAQSQNVGIGTTTPSSSAALDVSASNKGVLIPRLSSVQRKAIGSPAAGLLVFDTDKGTVMFYDGSAWRALSFSDENATDPQSRNSSQPLANSAFGTRVAISGNYAIISAPHYGSPNFNNMGACYIFNKTTSGWRQTARLAAYDSAASDYFGGSVAISGDYAVVGAANKRRGNNISQGRAYIYRRNGNNWVLDTALVNVQGAAYDQFGWSVGVCAFNAGGPGVAIGAPFSGANDAGIVHCYRKSGNSWSLVQNLVPTDLAGSDYYGNCIAMDTDYVAVGATGQDNSNYGYSDAGAVYVYAFGGGVWNFQQKMQGVTVRGQFGFSISLSSNKMAIGAPWTTTYTNTSASVYLYERAGSTWTNITSLFIYNFEVVPNAGQIQPISGGSSISIANLTFGISVSLSGNTLLVGSSGGIFYPSGGSSYYSDRVGAVYLYKNFSGNSFTRVNIIQSQFPKIGDLFGMSVGISGGKYVIGSPQSIINGLVNAGNVYFGE